MTACSHWLGPFAPPSTRYTCTPTAKHTVNSIIRLNSNQMKENIEKSYSGTSRPVFWVKRTLSRRRRYHYTFVSIEDEQWNNVQKPIEIIFYSNLNLHKWSKDENFYKELYKDKLQHDSETFWEKGELRKRPFCSSYLPWNILINFLAFISASWQGKRFLKCGIDLVEPEVARWLTASFRSCNRKSRIREKHNQHLLIYLFELIYALNNCVIEYLLWEQMIRSNHHSQTRGRSHVRLAIWPNSHIVAYRQTFRKRNSSLHRQRTWDRRLEKRFQKR